MPNMDMHTNLVWARGIHEQGWLDAVPYQQWTDWMQSIAPYPTWVRWWGGEQIFHQSPLYAYFLSLFLHNLEVARAAQALMSMATCVFLGLLANRIANRGAGWLAFWIAALYAPFYAYSWPFLRDGIGWFLTAAVLWALSELTAAPWPSVRSSVFAWVSGLLLGLGFLARETFLLLIPVTWVALACFAWKRRQAGLIVRVVLATSLAVFPLVLRNAIVGAPLLSTSNRAAEVFILGNAATSHPYISTVPAETAAIFRQTQGKTLPAIVSTIGSHPDGLRGWMHLQVLRVLSLFDPYESPDNLSFYFVAHISPVVRFGLRYWMIVPVGLGGLVLSLWRREWSHLWMWLFLPPCLLSLLIGTAVSRYRQTLMIFLIPWAACFLLFVWQLIRGGKYRPALYAVLAVCLGWALELGPLSRQPRDQYERPSEYVACIGVFHFMGDPQKARAMADFVRHRFPGALPPTSRD